MAVDPIPPGYGTVTPYLVAEDANATIRFLREAFGAEEIFRMDGPDGRLWHGEVQIGTSRLMLTQANAQHAAQPAYFYLYVPDVDATYAQALRAGGTSTMEPANQFYGDRNAGIQDPGGNHWWIAAHVEDVPPEELQRRAEAYQAQHAATVEAVPAQ